MFIASIFVSFLLGADYSQSSCVRRQDFFINTNDGTLAFVKDAESLDDLRTMYSGWCPLRNQTTQETGGDKFYFALNNRSSVALQPRYYVVKIFRHSRATEFRPLLSLARGGQWQNLMCRNQRVAWPDKVASTGSAVVTAFMDSLRFYDRHAIDAGCSLPGQWFAKAFGDPSLDLSNEIGFLSDIPDRVQQIGLNKWSLNVVAFSYGTVTESNRTADFPKLIVTRDGADEIIVQYISSGSKFHEFRLMPS